MIARQIVIGLRQGVTFEEAAELVQAAGRFASRITIEQRSKLVNAKSMMGLLSMGLVHGSSVLLTADGSDEKEAVDALRKLLSSEA